MAEQQEEKQVTEVVCGFYNDINRETNFVCRVNKDDMTSAQIQLFEQLNEEIKKRYYGSGLNIPENVEGKRILDIGCGSGSFVFMLSKLVGPTGHVVGIDLCDGLIETAKSQSDYHRDMWGYEKANFEFHNINAETLDEQKFDPFDIIVSNGVFCLIPDKVRVFKAAYALLKPGGQFILNDVYAERDPPEEHKHNVTLWCLGTTGSMRSDVLAGILTSVGFTTPYLMCAAPVSVCNPEYINMLGDRRYSCAGWRLFKLDPKAPKRGASLVTYNGGVQGHPDTFTWDINLTFKKGEGVKVDGELATLLSNSYLANCFTFQDVSDTVVTQRNQDPFKRMDQLKSQGKMPEVIYKIE